LIVVLNREEKRRVDAESNALLETLISSKQELLSDWFSDEIDDVSLIVKSPSLIQLTSRYVEGSADVLALVAAYNQIRFEHNYAELVFLNEAGEYLASTNPALTFNDSIDRDILAQALKYDSSFVSDIYRSSIDHRIYIDLVTVIRNAYGKPLGGIIFKIHAEKSIDKFLTDWQMESYKCKVSLIQQQSDKKWHVYHPDSSNASTQPCWQPLSKRLRNDPSSPRHRFVRVCKLSHTPWDLMAELDNSKRKAEINTSITISGMIGALSLLIFFFGLLYLAYKQEKIYSKRFREKENALDLIKNQFQFSMDMLSEAIIFTDAQGAIRYMNLAAEMLSGWKLVDIEGKPLEKQIPLMQEESGMSLLNVKNWFSGERAYNQDVAAYLINKAGIQIPVICSLAPLQRDQPDSDGLIVVFTTKD